MQTVATPSGREKTRPSRDGEAGLRPAEPKGGKVWKPSQGFHINDLR
jgi:hypothetical protein